MIVDNLEGNGDLLVIEVSKYKVFMFSLIVENNCWCFGLVRGGKELGFVLVVSIEEGYNGLLVYKFFVG